VEIKLKIFDNGCEETVKEASSADFNCPSWVFIIIGLVDHPSHTQLTGSFLF